MQQVVVMEFGKRHSTTDTTDFCTRQLVTDLLRGKQLYVTVTDFGLNPTPLKRDHWPLTNCWLHVTKAYSWVRSPTPDGSECMSQLYNTPYTAVHNHINKWKPVNFHHDTEFHRIPHSVDSLLWALNKLSSDSALHLSGVGLNRVPACLAGVRRASSLVLGGRLVPCKVFGDSFRRLFVAVGNGAATIVAEKTATNFRRQFVVVFGEYSR